MKVKVVIEVHLSKEIEIEAIDMGKAMEIAEEYYHNGDFCFDTQLEPTAKLMMAKTEDECTEWVEF